MFTKYLLYLFRFSQEFQECSLSDKCFTKKYLFSPFSRKMFYPNHTKFSENTTKYNKIIDLKLETNAMNI